MDTSIQSPPPDLIASIRLVEPNRIRDRLRALEAERQALLVLLRAALAVSRSDRKEAGRG
jgi:hypothetical protein